MDKKDIYEHLAKIYLDASSKKKKKVKGYSKIFKNLFFVSVLFIFTLSSVLFLNFKRGKSFNSEIALVLLSEAAKINFHFDPARKETYSLNLNNLDLTRYRQLGFSLKNVTYKNGISMRVEFANNFKEKSEVYFKDIPHNWQDYRVKLSEFKGISDWSGMRNLTFAIEEWNAREKKGVVYIDNIRLLR
jgi:hypothetical protein